jgi:hypothetical protein
LPSTQARPKSTTQEFTLEKKKNPNPKIIKIIRGLQFMRKKIKIEDPIWIGQHPIGSIQIRIWIWIQAKSDELIK